MDHNSRLGAGLPQESKLLHHRERGAEIPTSDGPSQVPKNEVVLRHGFPAASLASVDERPHLHLPLGAESTVAMRIYCCQARANLGWP